MKVLKNISLIFFFSIFSSFILNAALVDCGCSNDIGSGTFSVSWQSAGDCCSQLGNASIEVFTYDGDSLYTMQTSSNQSHHCYDC